MLRSSSRIGFSFERTPSSTRSVWSILDTETESQVWEGQKVVSFAEPLEREKSRSM